MEQQSRGFYQEVAAFFLPLSLTSLLITLSHSVVNAGVARTPNPEVALAAYALARSFVLMIENPMFMVRQTVVSLSQNLASFLQVRRFVYIIAVGITGFLAVLGFSPAGYYALRYVLGASQEIAAEGHRALAILFLLPLTTVSRNLYHGVAILTRRTVLVPLSTFVRLLVMGGVVFSLAYATDWPGAVIASISFVGAFFIEAFIMRWKARPLLSDRTCFPESEAGAASLTTLQIARFYLPLTVTTLVATATAPLVNTGLARSTDPEVALAGYAVGHALSLLFLAPAGMLHQCALAFTDPAKRESYRMVKTFIAVFALLLSTTLGLISYTRLGPWLLAGPMGVTAEVQAAALGVMRVLTLLPLLFGWREYLWGIFMQQKLTKIIGGAKAFNLCVTAVTLTVLLFGGWVDPGAAGAWALLVGELADCLVMLHFYQRHKGRWQGAYARSSSSTAST